MSKNSIKQILVPLDGSKNSIRGLNFAINIAKKLEASITGFHVVPATYVYGIYPTKKIKSKARKKAEAIMTNAASKCKKKGIRFNSKIQYEGNIAKSIIKFSEDNNYDFIVIGSKGHGLEHGLFLGSVANHVLHKSSLPVTIVK